MQNPLQQQDYGEEGEEEYSDDEENMEAEGLHNDQTSEGFNGNGDFMGGSTIQSGGDGHATSQWEATEDNNFGFQGLEEDPALTAAKKRKAEESAKTKELKEKIRVLLTRYNRLVPRTSHALMQKLEGLTEGELDNVYKNCLTDVQEFRGMKAAECITLAITYPVDTFLLPNYTQHCLRDQELLRDIDAELQDMVGYFSNRMQILIRLMSNAYEVYCKQGMLSDQPFNDYEMNSFIRQQAIQKRREMEINDISLNQNPDTQPVIQSVLQLNTQLKPPTGLKNPFEQALTHAHET